MTEQEKQALDGTRGQSPVVFVGNQVYAPDQFAEELALVSPRTARRVQAQARHGFEVWTWKLEYSRFLGQELYKADRHFVDADGNRVN